MVVASLILLWEHWETWNYVTTGIQLLSCLHTIPFGQNISAVSSKLLQVLTKFILPLLSHRWESWFTVSLSEYGKLQDWIVTPITVIQITFIFACGNQCSLSFEIQCSLNNKATCQNNKTSVTLHMSHYSLSYSTDQYPTILVGLTPVQY
jgi:hypothetical protein